MAVIIIHIVSIKKNMSLNNNDFIKNLGAILRFLFF